MVQDGPPEGMSFDEIIKAAIEGNIRAEAEWDESKKRGLRQVGVEFLTSLALVTTFPIN